MNSFGCSPVVGPCLVLEGGILSPSKLLDILPSHHCNRSYIMRMDHGKSTTTITGIGTSYDPTKGLEVDLNFVPRTAVFLAKVSLVQVFLSNLSGSSTPTKLTISISEDQQGDQFFLTDTQSTIQAGLTTSTDGTPTEPSGRSCKTCSKC